MNTRDIEEREKENKKIMKHEGRERQRKEERRKKRRKGGHRRRLGKKSEWSGKDQGEVTKGFRHEKTKSDKDGKKKKVRERDKNRKISKIRKG